MRVSFLVYGVLYVVIEMVGHQLDAVGWPQLTALDVATAVVNALLVVAVGIAVLVAVDVLGHRWRRRIRAWRAEQARLAEEQEQAPITVRAWRPGRLALTAGPVPTPYAGHGSAGTPRSGEPYMDPDFLDQHGRLL
jgi:peptidoglycan/LPS O-acetylase OafA/YrhL